MAIYPRRGCEARARGIGCLHDELLPIRERALGPEHPDTLTTRHALVECTGMAGDAAGARDQCAELLPIRERVLGPEHPYTLAIRTSLADWTLKADGDVAPGVK